MTPRILSNLLRLLVAIGAIYLLCFLGFTVKVLFFNPSWQLSVRNSADGVVVEIYKSDEAIPTYSTVLANRKVAREVQRCLREDLPADVGQTTFYDITIRPGRWTVMVDGAKLDIMECGLFDENDNLLAPAKD